MILYASNSFDNKRYEESELICKNILKNINYNQEDINYIEAMTILERCENIKNNFSRNWADEK